MNMTCPKCGNTAEEGAVFCSKCGTKIQSDESSSQIPDVSVKSNDTISHGEINAQASTEKSKNLITKKWWFWGIIAVVAIIIIATFSGGTENAGSATGDTNLVNGTTEDTSSTDKENGSKTMSAADIYVLISEKDEFGYSVPEKAVSFIENNPQFFPGSDKNTGAMSDYVDYEADYPHIAKSPTKYADKLMSVYGNIVDCAEFETDYGTVTYLQIEDYSGYSYCMYYLGVLEDAFKGYSAWANVLPFGTIIFENVGGYYTEAVIGAACYVEVDNYDDY